jgi:hypothetical protein
VCRGGQHGLGAETLGSAYDALIVGRNQHLARTGRAGTLMYPLHHRPAGDRQQRLAWKPR